MRISANRLNLAKFQTVVFRVKFLVVFKLKIKLTIVIDRCFLNRPVINVRRILHPPNLMRARRMDFLISIRKCLLTELT